ncbi:MAG: 3'-5' exonuclease [Bacteroidales bacterium]|nr:3'-5' exonuclease [Bacteroidales bacterium]
MYLFFDTETTGLPRNWRAPVTDVNNWPRLVQLAYLLYDNNGNKVSGGDFIIKPEGFTIPLAASRVHRITTERALSEGQSIAGVLQHFDALVKEASFLVAHNMSFDEMIVGAEFIRNGIQIVWHQKPEFAPCNAQQTSVPSMVRMDTNGRSCRNCITNCSVPASTKPTMPRLTLPPPQPVSGNCEG